VLAAADRARLTAALEQVLDKLRAASAAARDRPSAKRRQPKGKEPQ
jgi:hypothetical protein